MLKYRREEFMRLRNVKNKEIILKECPYFIENGEDYRGKWQEVFGNKNPIYLEIGMGKGNFLIQNALLHKDINFIGIEKFDSVLARAIPKIPEGLTNFKILRMDAVEIEKVFDHEISHLFLNFSDPWPKARHAFRRLTSPLFLKRYDSIFKKEKEIEMKTDNETLFVYSLQTLTQAGYALFDLSFDYHKTHTNIIMSEYEERFVNQGNVVFYLFAKKR